MNLKAANSTHQTWPTEGLRHCACLHPVFQPFGNHFELGMQYERYVCIIHFNRDVRKIWRHDKFCTRC